MPSRVRVIDSHTGGEPTRLIVSGGPNLGGGTVREQAERFRERFDHFRRGVIEEPRGYDFLVGGLLVPPADPTAVAGVIFFNNVGLLGMCGHGTIGLAVTLAHLGRLGPGRHHLETPVGLVDFQLLDPQTVTVWNVPSYRYREAVTFRLPGFGNITGDIAWGGNWFFITHQPEWTLTQERAVTLTSICQRIRETLRSEEMTGENGAEIDHIEITGPAHDPANQARNFVLCPGGAYDRSPCGTGTSAKLACLIAGGKLQPGELWRQESITGSLFTATATIQEDHTLPQITGTAFLTAESELIFDPADPLLHSAIRDSTAGPGKW